MSKKQTVFGIMLYYTDGDDSEIVTAEQFFFTEKKAKAYAKTFAEAVVHTYPGAKIREFGDENSGGYEVDVGTHERVFCGRIITRTLNHGT